MPRHDDVGEQQRRCPDASSSMAQRPRRRRRRSDDVAELAQRRRRSTAATRSSSSTTRIVSPAAARLDGGPGGARRRRVLAEMARQVDLDRRALPDLAVDLHVAAGLLDEAEDLAEAQAGALADLLGGEERIERPRRDLGGMPVPVSVTAIITYGPAGDLGVLRGVGVVEMALAVSMVSLPPSGMASRALTARLRIGVLDLARIGVGPPQPAGRARSRSRSARPACGAAGPTCRRPAGWRRRLAAPAAAGARRRAGAASASAARWRRHRSADVEERARSSVSPLRQPALRSARGCR